jgi:bifunctional polynucleotide phosphatase/kinase
MKRCPNGSRRNKKTGLCVKIKEQNDTISGTHETKSEMRETKKNKRCPKGSKKNKKTGLCKRIEKQNKPIPNKTTHIPTNKDIIESNPSKELTSKSINKITPDKEEIIYPIIKETTNKNIVIESNPNISKSKNFAIFDVDWTLIKPKEGRKFPQNVDDWQWLRKSVPETIKKYYDDGYRIVFLTDQSKPWKITMIENVIKNLNIHITCLIAMNKAFHKPNPAFFMENFSDIYDRNTSFYVGDAAGRDDDWSRNDIDLASNIGVKFYTPEEIFLLEKPHAKEIKIEDKNNEVIIMVGYPASGKTTTAKEMEKQGYIRIDGDSLKTGPKMVKEAEKYAGKHSIIFDATNGTKERRKYYIDFAKKHNMKVRCLWKTTSIDLSMEQNRERQKQGGPKVPDIVFYTYRKRFEEPSQDECIVEKI